MNPVKKIKSLANKEHWGQHGGYYTQKPDDLRNNPISLLTSPKAADKKLIRYFDKYLPKYPGLHLLEIGCGSSATLPYFATKFNYQITGIDYNQYALALARANLEGHGIKGNLYCRDILNRDKNKNILNTFDIIYSAGVIEHFEDAVGALTLIREFLKPNGLILTTVPNLQGINHLLQKFIDPTILDIHIIHNKTTLRSTHETAGFTTILCEYTGVYDGWLTESSGTTSAYRKKMHHYYCYITNIIVHTILKYTNYKIMPELSYTSPHILFIGKKLGI
jgi:SAM-dependent methyltransferase